MTPRPDPLLASQPTCDRHGVIVRDHHDLIEKRTVEHVRHEPDSDPGHQVRAGRLTGEHGGPGRFHRHHPDSRLSGLQDFARTGDRAAGAHAGHEDVDRAVRVLPDVEGARRVRSTSSTAWSG